MIDVKSLFLDACEEFARLLVALLAVFVLQILLLTGLRAAWGLYGGTSIGQHMMEKSTDLNASIQSLLLLPSVEFAVAISLVVFLFILPLALMAQFFHLRHFLYMPMPWVVKILWACVAAYFIADILQAQFPVLDDQAAYFAVLPATLCLLPVCLRIASNILPDLLSCIMFAVSWMRN